MKIAIAQAKSVTGNITANIKKHVSFVKKAIVFNADLIVFPELSITSYEPALAKDLAIELSDDRFTVFQNLSDTNNTTIVIGAPLMHKNAIRISLLIFQPHKQRTSYAKQILHKDELPYFVCGTEQVYNTIKDNKIAFAICYESMQIAHFLNTYKNNIDIYITSVAKTEKGVQKGNTHYRNISSKYRTTVIMANTIGIANGVLNTGQSTIFKNGKQLAQLNKMQEGLLIYDTVLNTTQTDYL